MWGQGGEATEYGEIALGVALAEVHRQVGEQPGQVGVEAIGGRAQGVADMQEGRFGRAFAEGAQAAHLAFGVGAGVAVDPGGVLAQGAGRSMQVGVQGAQVGQGVGFVMLGTMAAQGLAQAWAAPNQQAAMPAPPCQKPGRSR